MSTFVLPLADSSATLERVGGKGMSLAKMAQAGLPVPGGFHVTTEAYRCFVAENAIQPKILNILQGIDSADMARLEAASQQIAALFMAGAIPQEIARQVTGAYTALSTNHADRAVPVAVRSSATAEDLPEASFAGQQETYLNICGAEAVLAAIQKCWASLWTARAIAYRSRQAIPAEAVALAVVVQELVAAEVSGVLFTANPVSGKLDEMMITATWGLGEAIVGGLVTPDTLIVDKVHPRVVRRETSQKLVMTVRTATGTQEQAVPNHLQNARALSDEQAAELAKLGSTIEQLYGIPMDVEWAFAGDRFAIVQARPVTTLSVATPAETPLKWERLHPKALLARGSFAEFVPDPVSPLFATLAVPIAQAASLNLMETFLGNRDENNYIFEVINGYVYVGFGMSLKMIVRMLVLSIAQSSKMLKTGKARWAVARAKSRELADQWQPVPGGVWDLKTLPAAKLLEGAREIFSATADYYTVGQSGPIGEAPFSEMVFSRFYAAFVKGKQDPAASIFLLGCDTIPIRAEKSLYDLAMWVRGQRDLADAFLNTPTPQICAALRANPIPAPFSGSFAERFEAHQTEFGHILYDLDFAKPTPADDPAPSIEGLKVYLSGKGVSPYERQRAQAARREQAEQAILKRLDPLRRKWFTKLLHWAQASNPTREDCIADLGLGYPQLRGLFGEFGRRLAEGGAIAQPEDVYWLEAPEVESLAADLDAGKTLPPYHSQVERRKAFWQRVRRVNPPVTLPDKSFLSGMLAHHNPEGSTLKGYAASAGKVTARACVLRGPEEFATMRPGDVIVAVTTTPAWTPLFAMASAVVTDIGGPLSHSSIIAREYGIPAVMATGVATQRIQTGQTITVDGTAGLVSLG